MFERLYLRQRRLFTFVRHYASREVSCGTMTKVYRARMNSGRCNARPPSPPPPPSEFRLCPFCDDTPETETHFLLYCNKYNTLRQDFFNGKDLYCTYPDFDYKTDGDMITILMTKEFVKYTAAFNWRCFDIRRKLTLTFC